MNTNSIEKLNIIVFSLGTEIFGIETDYIINVIDNTQITPIPLSPQTLKGVINLRGSILPLVNTSALLGLSSLKKENSNFIVIEMESNNQNIKFAIEVDSVLDVIEVDNQNILPPPKLGINFPETYLKGMIKKDGKFISILNIEQTFNTECLYKKQIN